MMLKWNGERAWLSRLMFDALNPLAIRGRSDPEKFGGGIPAIPALMGVGGVALRRDGWAGRSGLQASNMYSIGVAYPIGSLANWLPREIAPTSRPPM